jgi:hypothetical protein
LEKCVKLFYRVFGFGLRDETGTSSRFDPNSAWKYIGGAKRDQVLWLLAEPSDQNSGRPEFFLYTFFFSTKPNPTA